MNISKQKFARLLGLCMALFITEFFGVRQVFAWYELEHFNYSNGELSTVSSGVWQPYSTFDEYQIVSNYAKATTTQISQNSFSGSAVMYGDLIWKNTSANYGAFQILTAPNSNPITFLVNSTSILESHNYANYTVTGIDWVHTRFKIDCNADTFTLYIGDESTTHALYDSCVTVNLFRLNQGSPASSNVQFDDILLTDNEQIWDPDVEVYELPDFEGDIHIGLEGSEISYPKNLICNITDDNDCQYTIRYGEDLIGWDFFLIPSAGITFPILDPELYAATSTALADQLQLKYSFNMATTTRGTIDYCVYLRELDEISANDRIYCDSSISHQSLEGLWEPTAFDSYCADACADLDSGDLSYPFSCALREAFCWCFNPSTESMNYLTSSVNALQEDFPMTVVNQAKQRIFGDIGTSSALSLSIDPLFPGDQSDAIFLTPTTFSEKLGAIWDDYFFPTMEYIMYFLTFLYLIGHVLKIRYSIHESVNVEPGTNFIAKKFKLSQRAR